MLVSWPDFDIMSFDCSYSMNMYLCILGLTFFYSWAVFGTGYHYFLLNGEHTVTAILLHRRHCMHACMHACVITASVSDYSTFALS